MTMLTVRGLDADTRARLRVRAAHNGRSMEAEVRAILHHALYGSTTETGLGSRIAARFAALDAADLEIPARDEPPRAAEFDT